MLDHMFSTELLTEIFSQISTLKHYFRTFVITRPSNVTPKEELILEKLAWSGVKMRTG